jgi:hypothetical protein
MERRISNLEAERQVAEIEKEKLRQLREAAENHRLAAEARAANAVAEVHKSRAAISRIASLETDLTRAIAERDVAVDKYATEIRAVKAESDLVHAKLEAELDLALKQLDRKRAKKRAHKKQAAELASR